MKFLLIFGIFLILLVQASLQYPHHQHHKKHLNLVLVPETTAEEVFNNPQNIDERNDKGEDQILVNSANDNIVLLNSEDLANLFAIKTVDTNPDFVLGSSQKRYRRGTDDPPVYAEVYEPKIDRYTGKVQNPNLLPPPKITVDFSRLASPLVEPKVSIQGDPNTGYYDLGAKLTDKSKDFQPYVSANYDSNGDVKVGTGFQYKYLNANANYQPQTGNLYFGLGFRRPL